MEKADEVERIVVELPSQKIELYYPEKINAGQAFRFLFQKGLWAGTGLAGIRGLR